MRNKVETKVVAGTGAAAGSAGVVGTLLIWVYGAWLGGVGFAATDVEKAVAAVPYPVSAAILAVVAAAATFIAGYKAPRTTDAEFHRLDAYEPRHDNDGDESVQ